MDFAELNRRLAAADAPPVYFARYSPGDSIGEYATGGYLGIAISIVDRGEYLAWGTSERGEFIEGMNHFATEAEMFDFLEAYLTTPPPPPTPIDPEVLKRAERYSPQRGLDWLEARQRKLDIDGKS